jgi:hypothetical protein
MPTRLNLRQRITNEYNPEVMRAIMADIETFVNLLAGGSIQCRGTSAAAPTTGSWARGDFLWNSAPSSGGLIGFVCVTGGTPGTWKTWGAIS